ncbi:MAG: hypothetical protein AAB276_05095, partial [Pseudomonadota bacterium]
MAIKNGYKIMKFKNLHLLTALILGMILPLAINAPAFADKEGRHGHGNNGYSQNQHSQSHGRYEDQERYNEDRNPRVVIYDNDHDIVRGYITRDYNKHCPHGLKKKHNGCQPPGHAKRYIIGDTLPRDVVYYQLPDDILVHMRPAPRGYEYVRVDTDILLIGEASKKIIDAVTLLSAVGQ